MKERGKRTIKRSCSHQPMNPYPQRRAQSADTFYPLASGKPHRATQEQTAQSLLSKQQSATVQLPPKLEDEEDDEHNRVAKSETSALFAAVHCASAKSTHVAGAPFDV